MVVEQVEEAEATAMLVVQNWYEESATASRAKSQEKNCIAPVAHIPVGISPSHSQSETFDC